MLRDRKYLDHLRTLPCLCTGQYARPDDAVDPCHIGTAGKGIKSPDNEAIPLLHSVHALCHQAGEHSVLREYLPHTVLVTMRHIYLDYCEAEELPIGQLPKTGTREWVASDFMHALRLLARQEYQTWLDGSRPFAGL